MEQNESEQESAEVKEALMCLGKAIALLEDMPWERLDRVNGMATPRELEMAKRVLDYVSTAMAIMEAMPNPLGAEEALIRLRNLTVFMHKLYPNIPVTLVTCIALRHLKRT